MTRTSGAREQGSTDGPDEDLGSELSRMSAEALALATAATERSDFATAHDRAQELSDRLGELWPRVEAAAATERGGLERAWSDARLDLGYVLSEGELTPSVRLYRAQQDRGPS